MAIDPNKSYEVENGFTIDQDTGVWVGGGLAAPTVNAPQGSVYFRIAPSEQYRQEGVGLNNTWVIVEDEYSDGGEARGKDRILGNTDDFLLTLITDNTPRIVFDGSQIILKHPTTPASDTILDTDNGFGGFGISKSGASGFMNYMPNSQSPQIIAGDPSAGVGVNNWYMDTDNGGTMRLNVLPGAGAGGEIVATCGAPLRPDIDITSDLGRIDKRWLNIYGHKACIREGAGAGFSADANANNIVMESDQLNAGMSLLSPSGGNSNLYFGNIDDGTKAGFMQYISSVNELRLGVMNAEQIRVSTTKARLINQIEINGGSPGAGKVLTSSDANGLATWETPAGGSGDFSDGGEAGGAARSLGNTDNFDFDFLTNSLSRIRIEADGKVLVGSSQASDYVLEVHNQAATGNGLKLMSGEVLGDIALHIADQDDTFRIMEIEADQGFITMGKTYAQTLADNGIVYGVDLQNTGNEGDNAISFNTQHGTYRIAGRPKAYMTEYQDAESDGQSSTTSTTLQTKLSMTTPVLPAGRYRIGYTFELSNASNGVLSEAVVEIDGNSDATTTFEADNDFHTLGGFKYENLSGAVDVDIKYRVQTSGTCLIRRARLEIWRIS